MNQELPPLTSYSEELRQNAMDKYQVIAPYLKHEESLSNIAEDKGLQTCCRSKYRTPCTDGR